MKTKRTWKKYVRAVEICKTGFRTLLINREDLSAPTSVLGKGALLYDYGKQNVTVKKILGHATPTNGSNEIIGDVPEVSSEDVNLFVRELALVKRLSHQNIVRTLGFTYDYKGALLIIQETMLGGTLKPIVTQKSKKYGSREGLSWAVRSKEY